MERFTELLQELGKLIDAPLHPDKYNACRLNVNNILHIQLEWDASKEQMLIAAFVCDIPAGRYRENVLKEGLKANGVFPRIGTFAYSERNNKLTLFEYIPFDGLNAEKLANYLQSFIAKSLEWKNIIETGSPFPVITPSRVTEEKMFGL